MLWQPPDPGALRDRMTFETPTETRNSMGESVATWGPVQSVAAWVQSVGGLELWQRQQLRPELTDTITTRYFPGITPKMRGNVNGRILSFLRVYDPTGRKEWLVYEAKEEV